MEVITRRRKFRVPSTYTIIKSLFSLKEDAWYNIKNKYKHHSKIDLDYKLPGFI